MQSSDELPQQALLARYQREGAYTDCYFVEVPQAVLQEQYVEAFYTTALFKLERMILAALVAKPSSDTQARRLALGEATEFAAWTVEGRTGNQLLMCDFLGRTRSWLMSVPMEGEPAVTRLYFGSAFLPKRKSEAGKASFGFEFHALSGFHRLYSRALLHAVAYRLSRQERGG